MSYGEAVPPLDFSQINTACLTGDNGHGKSTLLDAVTWSLWGQTRAKNLDDIVRLGQEEAEVEFVFDLEGAQYRVIRKRSLRTRAGLSSLELQGFDPQTQQFCSISGNSIRETETKIVQLLHMNYDTFINSVFVLQGRADEFTTRRPGERKRILAEILGLSIFDELEVRAREHRGSLDHEVKTLQQRMEELRLEVARKNELAAAVTTHQETLRQLQTASQIEQQRLEQLRQDQTMLGLQSQRAQEAERRLQQLQREYADLDRQRAVHQRRAAAHETVLRQEAAIQAGFDTLQALKDQEQRESAKAERYAAWQQRQSELQRAITAAQHHLELERSSTQQRLQDTQRSLQACAAILQNAPRITADYDALQMARQREAAMAQSLQRRYTLEQEKTQIERRIQQKRHALELEQRTLLARQQEWQQKESHLPTWQQQIGSVQQHLAQIEQQAARFDQIRTEGVELKVRIESSLPQTMKTLQQEIDQQHEKRQLLSAAGAHCPLCERTLSDADRRRVLQNLSRDIAGYADRIRLLQEELRQLEQQRRQLRVEYRTLEQHLEQRQTLEQQYTTLQVNLTEATRARENLAAAADKLQQLEAQLASGTYAGEDLAHLQKLAADLEGYAYDAQQHEALKRELATLMSAEFDRQRLQQAMADQARLSELENELQQKLAVVEQTLSKRQFAVAEQDEWRQVTDHMAQLNFNPGAYNLLRQRLQEHQHFERQHVELETARQHLNEERALLQELEGRKQRYEAELLSVESERQQLLQGLDILEQLRSDRVRTEALLQNLQHREGEARLALGRSQSQYEHCVQREAELQEKTAQHTQRVEERTLYGDLVTLFGKNGIQAIIIENAIPELEDEANRILSRVTDNAMHLTLETQRDTRAGGVVETLDIKISDTLGTRNYELFSGGEAFRINFALRIALSKMLARRAGARLRTLVIDEGFGTQDTQGLERLVEIIKAIRDDFDKIIIITHLRELKNAFDTYIEVKKDPVLGSTYQVF
jgi:exonuclease SbcC